MKMKGMKHLFYIALAFIFLMTSCSGNDDEVKVMPVSQESFTWTSEITQQPLQINASGSWRIQSDVDWCQPVKDSGNGKYKLSLWVSPNITSEARSGNLTISSGKTTQTISLNQPAYTGSTDDYTYRIPVLFHILYDDANDENKYVKKGRMEQIIKKVNKLYADCEMNIQFELAEIDENGDSIEEPGVIREKVDFDTLSCMTFLSEESTYGKYNQNFKKYINVFVFKYTEENTLGVSDLPVMPTDQKMDGLSDQAGEELEQFTTLSFPWGVTLNNRYIYEDPRENYLVPLNVVLTLAHELGHYLGLLHTFSQDECNEDDYCDDTKNCDYNAYTEKLDRYFEEIERTGGQAEAKVVLTRTDCTTAEDYQANNILDYMYTKGDSLTRQQFDRTRKVLLYCPMMPGPRLVTYKSKSTRGGIPAPIVPRISNCPPTSRNSSLNKQ